MTSKKYEKGSGKDGQTGKLIGKRVYEALQEWDCVEKIKAMSFDTTSANTGHLSAACIKIQENLNKALIWLACRHHIGEIIVSHVYKALKIETSKSPDSQLFTRFRENWELIENKTKHFKRYELSNHTGEALTLVERLRENSINIIKNTTSLVRDDYKELCNLCLSYLGDPEHITNEPALQRPEESDLQHLNMAL